jgi:hypothetical protein
MNFRSIQQLKKALFHITGNIVLYKTLSATFDSQCFKEGGVEYLADHDNWKRVILLFITKITRVFQMKLITVTGSDKSNKIRATNSLTGIFSHSFRCFQKFFNNTLRNFCLVQTLLNHTARLFG